MSANGAFLGRELKLLPNATGDDSVLGIRSKTVTLVGEAPDITSDDDDSFQRFFTEAPRIGIDLAVEGIAKGSFIQRVAAGNNTLALVDYTLTSPQVGTWRGDWLVDQVAMTGPTDEIATFSARIRSDGPYVFTPEE